MKLVIIGAGGHAAVVIEAVQAMGRFKLIGIVDPTPAAPEIFGIPVLGDDDILPSLRSQGVEAAFIALGNNCARQKIGTHLLQRGFILPVVVHPSALISPSAMIGTGAIVMARAVVGTRARIGAFAIVNTGAIVDHDSTVAAAAHIAPGVALAGNVTIGERSLIGVGSAARPGITVGMDAVVGAGSALVANVPTGATVGGAPARTLRRPT